MESAISDETIFNYCLMVLLLAGPPTFISLLFLQAPYGKHNRPGWGPTVSPAIAWFVMESPTLWITFLVFPFGRHCLNLKAIILMLPYLIHYFHRTVIYPLRLRRDSDPSARNRGFPVSVAAMAFGFNLLNAYLQARWVSQYKSNYDGRWFWWQLGVGMAVFIAGMRINVWADKQLVRMKKESGGSYVVPKGGLFELISSPNYFGEIVEWLGWSIMTWSWPGIAFFLYTFANLVPRACANHRWYLDKFKDEYPKSRKAVIPFLV